MGRLATVLLPLDGMCAKVPGVFCETKLTVKRPAATETLKIRRTSVTLEKCTSRHGNLQGSASSEIASMLMWPEQYANGNRIQLYTCSAPHTIR